MNTEGVKKNPLCVLILVHNIAWKGGAFYHGLGFARQLAEMGHEVSMMAISPHNRFRLEKSFVDGIHLIETPDLLFGRGRTGWDVWDTLRRILHLRSMQFDVIHTVDTRPAVVIPALFARFWKGGVFIADWTDWWGRGGATDERPGWLIKTFIGPLELIFEEGPRPWADGTIAISKALYERARGLGISEDTMIYLYPGCDTNRITSVSKDEARKHLNIDSEELRIGYLGNAYQRDADLLYAATRKVRGTIPNCTLVMIGSTNAQMPQEAIDAGWLKRTGQIPFDEVIQQLGACDVLVLPLNDTVANRGRWPSKINDYLAAGRPIITNAVGDIANIFKQAKIGYLTEPNAEDFADKIQTLLLNPDEGKNMGINARKLAETEFAWLNIGRQLEDFYYKIISKKQSPK